MNVNYLINRAVKEYPGNIALIYKHTRMTFRDLNTRVNRLANAFLKLRMEKGDRVGMLLRNCSEFIEIDFALSKTGMVRVPLNARLTGSDHEYMLNDSGANTLFFWEEFTEIVQTFKPKLKTVNLLNQYKTKDIECIAGGIIPAEDIRVLKQMGVNEIFPPETPTSEIIDFVRNLIEGP
jgi:acyl-CoA synthetase (AMP-forming)/AMP-acid ligase II